MATTRLPPGGPARERSLKRLACLLLILPFLMVPACSDDPAAPTDDIRVTVRVRDAAGDPVAGLYLTLLSDNEFLQDDFPDKRGGKASVTIPFTLARYAHIDVTVEDIEGGLITTLADSMASAGVHQVVWNGRDDAGVYQPSGRYTVRLVVKDELGTMLHEQTRDMLLATFSASVGVTDDGGRLVLTDRRLFPHLYDRPALDAVDEMGEFMGSFTLSEDMIFRLTDDPQTATQTRRVQVVGDGASVDMVWDPQVRTSAAADATVRAPVVQGADVPPIGFNLGQPFPNPFN